MGSSILKGITTALLVTVITLFAGIVWVVMHLGGLTISQLLDIGLLASCLIGGYRAARDSGEWLLGGVVGAGYVTLGTLLLTFFLPVQGWGFIQVLAEGAVIGLVAGAVGAGGAKGSSRSVWSGNRSSATPYYAGYATNDRDSHNYDWDQEEKQNNWRETPKSKGRGREDESPEVQWSWDKEEKEDKKERKEREEREETHDWKEETINTRIQRSEKNPEVEWPWDQEQDAPKDWKEDPIINRIESGEKSSVIKWPWNRDKKELVDSGPRQVEPRYVEPLKISTSTSKSQSKYNLSGERPWWE